MLSYIGGQAPWTSTSCSSWSSPKSFQSTDFLRNMNPTAMADLRKLLSRLNLVGYVVDAYIFWLSCLWGSTFRGHFLFVVKVVVDVAAKRRRLPKCPFFFIRQQKSTNTFFFLSSFSMSCHQLPRLRWKATTSSDEVLSLFFSHRC